MDDQDSSQPINPKSIDSSTSTNTTSSSSNTNKDHYLKHVHKMSQKITKIPSFKFDHLNHHIGTSSQPSSFRSRQQPPVYNVSKSDFRDVVQKLTGCPAHDVFLSFRGRDTRKTFVDHLYTALVQQGIDTYKDDEALPRGESITPSLLKAIQESRIAVVVFSKNYSESSWCLDELAFIMKCMDERGQVVLPVFYDVEPSEVRNQKRKYGETFAKYESENNNKVEFWRKALVRAANLSGWEPKHIANGHESKCIKEIVDTISLKLVPLMSSANANLIGIKPRIQDLKSRLQVGLGGVRMVGIWGIGGGGKSTLAFAIYKEICCHFDSCCFLENVREESTKYGLKRLQETILSHVLNSKELEVRNIEEGKCMIRSRLCNKSVLIVLDDVDHIDHLRALAGSHDWFGNGSRIIITTRDVHLLNAHRVNEIYRLSLLNHGEAIELFSRHAFGARRPLEGYETLTLNVISRVGGLPLALIILGTFLCDKDTSEWICALARLEAIPELEIVEKLKISYDGLKSQEKELFLDIACFFRRKSKDKTMKILDACGYHSLIGVKVLIQKALITVSRGTFDMHDLVQEMGHYIVRVEHPNNPEKHSRVWQNKDVIDICDMDAMKENNEIEVIQIKCFKDGSPKYLPRVVANMKKLRLISWDCFPASSMPINFQPTKLCCLILECGMQKQLWKGYKHLPSLKVIDLSFSMNLIMTPDLDGLPNLEQLMLYGCGNLKEIHPSLGHSKNLVYLNLGGCYSLTVLPPIIQLKKVKTLVLSHCRKLHRFPEVQNTMDSLEYLLLEGSGIEFVPSSIGKDCPNLVHVDLSYCNDHSCDTNLKKLPEEVINLYHCLTDLSLPHKSLKHIGLQLFHRTLRRLDLRNCKLGDGHIAVAVWELSNLQELDLRENEFSRLDFSLLLLPVLKLLNVSDCKSLVEMSELPSSIAVLIAENCYSLKSVGDISKCKWLWKVSLLKRENQDVVGREILYYMHQGNAIENYFLSLSLPGFDFLKGFVPSLVRGKRFTLQLPQNWCNAFCGFLICTVSDSYNSSITMTIKQEIGKSSQSKPWQKHIETPEPPECHFDLATHVGYVSFTSLRHTEWWNSDCNKIWFFLDGIIEEIGFGVSLVPRMSTVNPVQTTKEATDCSEFRDEAHKNVKTFMIQYDSKESIKVLWRPRISQTRALKYPMQRWCGNHKQELLL